MNIAITGCNGLLGSTLLRLSHLNGVNAIKLSRDKLNKKTLIELALYLAKIKCSVLIHCAANTNVEACETAPKSCYTDNIFLTELIANACRICKIKLVFISSTGVYGKHQEQPFCEYDDVIPTTVHHHSKWIAEQKVSNLVDEHLIIRTGWLFGGDWCMKKNFVANRIKEALQSEGTIYSNINQKGSPTYVNDLAQSIYSLLDSKWSGTFNCVNNGVATRFDYVSEIVKLAGLNVEVKESTEDTFKRIAKVSHNESAINHKLNSLRLSPMPHWKISLREYINELNAANEF